MIWKTQGSLCSPTVFLDQHMRVPYSRVLVGVKVSTDLEPLVWMKRSSTCFASAELLKVHLQKKVSQFLMLFLLVELESSVDNCPKSLSVTFWFRMSFATSQGFSTRDKDNGDKGNQDFLGNLIHFLTMKGDVEIFRRQFRGIKLFNSGKKFLKNMAHQVFLLFISQQINFFRTASTLKQRTWNLSLSGEKSTNNVLTLFTSP